MMELSSMADNILQDWANELIKAAPLPDPQHSQPRIWGASE